MKAEFKFDLLDPDDRDEFSMHCQSKEVHFFIFDLQEYIRGLLKYSCDLKEVEYKQIEDLNDFICEKLTEYNINMDVLR